MGGHTGRTEHASGNRGFSSGGFSKQEPSNKALNATGATRPRVKCAQHGQ